MFPLIDFLKKYWFNLLIVLILALLILYFIPALQLRYLQSEIDAVEKLSGILQNVLVVVIFCIFFVLGKKYAKKAVDYAKIFFGAFLLAAPFWFVLNPIFLFLIFFVNSLSATTTAEEKYKVIYADKEQEIVTLYDDRKFKTISTTNFFKNNNLNTGQVVTLVFKKGILGFNFDAVIKSDKP